jgi:hypothetical protein
MLYKDRSYDDLGLSGNGPQGGRSSKVEGMKKIIFDQRAKMITPNHMDWTGDVYERDALS